MALIYIRIDKLYKYYTEFIRTKKIKNSFIEKIHLRKVKDLKNMLEWLTLKISEHPKDLNDFKNKFITILETTFKLSEGLTILEKNKLPLNVKTLQWTLSKLDISVTERTASALIKYLKELELVTLRPIPLFTMDKKSRIYEFILRRGKVRYSSIISKFGESTKEVLELYSDNKVNIIGIEELGVKREDIKEVENIDVSQLNLKSRFIRIIRDAEGNIIPSIVIPRNTIIEIELGGVNNKR